jgi:hypothetical protein
MSRPTKGEIRTALKVHTDALSQLKGALLANDGAKVATYLEASSCAFETFEKLVVDRYPDEFEPAEGEVEMEDEEDLDEADEGDEDEAEEEEEDEDL